MHGFKKIKFLFSKKKSEKKPDWNLHLPVVEKFKKVFGDVRNGKPLVLFIKEILLDSTFKDLLYPAAKHQHLEKYLDAFIELSMWQYLGNSLRRNVLLTDIAKFDEKFDSLLSSSKFDSMISSSKFDSVLRAPKFLEEIRGIVVEYSKKAVPNLEDGISYEALKYRLAHWGVEKQIKIQWDNSTNPNYSEELSILVPAKLGELAFIVREITLPEVKILQQLVQEEHYRNLVLAFMLKQKIKAIGSLPFSELIFRQNSPVLNKYYYLAAQKENNVENFNAIMALRKSAQRGWMTKNEVDYFYVNFVGSGKKTNVNEDSDQIEVNISGAQLGIFRNFVKTVTDNVPWDQPEIQLLIKAIDTTFIDAMLRNVLPEFILKIVKESDELKELILHELF